MDIVFDIDGTLANASHRLHHVVAPDGFQGKFKKDWDKFLSDEAVAKDKPIEQTWEVLFSLLEAQNRIIFITGRPDAQRQVTYDWLNDPNCPVRAFAASHWASQSEIQGRKIGPILYMRSNGDRRPSSEVKRELLHRARADGFSPTLVFEDRMDDTAMWRSEGLLCCQVAEGNY